MTGLAGRVYELMSLDIIHTLVSKTNSEELLLELRDQIFLQGFESFDVFERSIE